MTAAQLHEEALDSMTASVGTKEGLQGGKAASILQKLASREADRRVQVEHQAASSRHPPQESELKEHLDKLAAAACGQEQAAAQASYFLPSYDSRQIANAISALRQQLEAAKKVHLGKKKFGFSRKPKQQSAQPAANQATQQSPSLPMPLTDSSPSSNQTQPLAEPAALQRKGLSNLHQQTITVNAQDLASGEYSLTNLTECTVRLNGPMASLHLRNLTNCAVATGPVAGPTFVYGAQDCCLQLASHQIRIHDAHKCKIYIRARSNPIIEHSDGLQFAPYKPDYPGSQQHLQAASLREDTGLWQQVQDFGWLKQSQSPNWCIMAQTDGGV